MKWKVIKLPMIAGEQDFYGREENSILWPNHYSEEELQELKSDPATFMALCQQEPQPQEGSWFNAEWLNTYDPNRLETNYLNRYIMVDPALSRNHSGNYTAMVVIGLGEDRNFYVLQFFRDRIDPFERADTLFRLVRKWRPIRVGYEEYGMLADIPYLKERMEQHNYRFAIQELGRKGPQHNLSKKDRIRQLIPLFREGRVWLPKEQPFEDSLGNEVDLTKVFIEQEYSRYPASTFDDMLDVLSRLCDTQMRFEWPEPKDDYSDDIGTRGSWLSG